MTARPLIVILAGSFALAPLALAKDHAVSRGGGGGSTVSHSRGGGSSSSSSSSGGTVSHSKGGPSSSGDTVSHSRADGSSSSESRSYPKAGTTAERRHPRPGTGTGSYSRNGYHRGGRYYPYPHTRGYYPGWGWGSYWWPYGSYYDGWYGGGYWGYPYGGWGSTHYYVHRDTGSVRVLVDPSEARVYVDGYYAGTVDDFDGLFQRLDVSPGRHEITLRLDGYRTWSAEVYATPDSTLELHHEMIPGASGPEFGDDRGPDGQPGIDEGPGPYEQPEPERERE